jgi:hypothetical protein
LDAYVNLLADQVQQRAEAIRQGRDALEILARRSRTLLGCSCCVDRASSRE